MFSAKVIKDSISQAGHRITTLQLRYQRFVHPEFLTHRVFSRSSSSSRAIPVAKMIQQVRENPAMPIHWGANQPGMQAKAEVTDIETAKRLWIHAARNAANLAEEMVQIGLHKQVANRILEPFQWISTIVTSTEWANFYELRDHKDADPNIENLAKHIRAAFKESIPMCLKRGEWHLPYIQGYMDLELAKKVSAARCARVSYLTHDGKEPSAEADLALFDRLAGMRPIHASPLEHIATPGLVDTGNFTGWTQFRKQWEKTL